MMPCWISLSVIPETYCAFVQVTRATGRMSPATEFLGQAAWLLRRGTASVSTLNPEYKAVLAPLATVLRLATRIR